MSKPFLGSGWGFPVTLDGTALSVARYEESVRQSIWIILGTARGERLMRPEFGCGIYDMVFGNVTATTAGRISQAVREALTTFEPRIDVLEVLATPEDNGEVMAISIDYQVRATNNMFNLVYPFYLERSAG